MRDLGLEGRFRGVSFDLRKGEILGFAGLVGSGRSNVAETLFGVTPATSGSILIKGEEIAINHPGTAMDAGMAFLTEDRKESGCFLLLDIMANMQIALLRDGYSTAGFVKEREIEGLCQQQKNRLRVRTPDLEEPIINLSGGNQQKVLIARWLMIKPRILILDEPTRGIDVGAKAEIHKLISELAGQGVAVLMISSELPEVLGMSDRILVMHEGRMTGIVDRKDANQVTDHGARVAVAARTVRLNRKAKEQRPWPPTFPPPRRPQPPTRRPPDAVAFRRSSASSA